MPVTTSLPVTIADINYGNHMGNDRFLAFFHEARLSFLSELSACELDIGEGIGLIMTEARVKYLSQASHGDVLNITVSVSDVQKASFTLEYHISRQKDGHTIANGSTHLCAFDYQRSRIARLPKDFKEKLSSQLPMSP